MFGHRFVGADDENNRAPFNRWLRETTTQEAVVFRSTDNRAQRQAVAAGAGIGFLSQWEANRTSGLVEVMQPRPEWGAPLWLVTHVDLHRTTKVQTFLTYLKSRAKEWS